MGHLDRMRNTLSAHRALAESFERDKAERIQSIKGWISDTEARLEEGRRRVAELPQQIATMQAELAELERLELLAREVIAIAEQATKKAALWEEIADQKDTELATLRAQRDELWEQLRPLKDAVLFARSQRRPMGIGQDSPRTAATVRLELGIEYGRTKDNAGFWIDSDELGLQDAESPDPAKRIALALLRLAHAVADKVRT